MKKYVVLFLLLILTTFMFAGEGVILHPNISYKTDDAEATVKGTHTLGDSVMVIGEEKNLDGKPYRSLKRLSEDDPQQYISSAYYVIDNSVQAVVTDTSYIYKYNDLSSITTEKLGKLTFVAAENYISSNKLTKVSFLLWSSKGNYWYVSTGWVKTSSLSIKKDDWGSAIKYFGATLEKDKEDQKKALLTITKINKSSIFIPLIKDMLERGDLKIRTDVALDKLYVGTGSELINSYEIVMFKDADINSEVLLEGSFKLKLNSKTVNKIDNNGVSDYMYNVTVNGLSGWIFGLK